MTQDQLLALIEQLESSIARVEDAMQSAHLAVKRLMADMKADEEVKVRKQLVAGQFRTRDGTMYETRKEE